MDRRLGRGLFWVLTVATIAVVCLWIAVIAHRAHRRNQTVAALGEIEHIESLMPGGFPQGIGSPPAPVQVRVPQPVRFAANGPSRLRAWLGESRCRNWLDTPV